MVAGDYIGTREHQKAPAKFGSQPWAPVTNVLLLKVLLPIGLASTKMHRQYVSMNVTDTLKLIKLAALGNAPSLVFVELKNESQQFTPIAKLSFLHTWDLHKT